MRCRPGLAFVSVLAASFLVVIPTAYAQCRLREPTSSFGAMGNPQMAHVRSIDAGVALADSVEGANILRWNGTSWGIVQQLIADDNSGEDGFGAIGRLRGNVAVVGAPYAPCDGGGQCGAVYVYRFDGSTWLLEARLTDPSSGPSSRFGRAIALGDGVIAVRSDEIDWLGLPFAGYLMYRFVDGAWVRDGMPIISSQNPLTQAGPIEIDGDTLLVGMPFERCDDGRECGKVWIYRYNGDSWSGDSVLGAADARRVDRFGSALALDGSRLVVGAPLSRCWNWDGSFCGAVYVFHRADQTWTQEAKLIAIDAQAGYEFGENIALQGNRILVGVPDYDGDSVRDLGAIYSYLFSGDTWSLETKIVGFSLLDYSSGLPEGVGLGRTLHIAGQLAVTTAGGEGITYVISGSDCNEDGSLDGCIGNVAPSAVEQSVPCDCASLSPVDTASTAVATGRFLPIDPGNTGRLTAIRVTSSQLPPPNDTANGRAMWVGEPFEVSEQSGSPDPAVAPESPTFMAAKLSCQPVYADRGAGDTLHVYGAGIVPGGTYRIEIIDGGCPLTQESSYSPPSEFETALWGDTVEDCSATPCAAPDGITHVIDTLAIINKFANAPGAIAKVRADLEPQTPDLVINISDALVALRAFSGLPYPFTVGDPCE